MNKDTDTDAFKKKAGQALARHHPSLKPMMNASTQMMPKLFHVHRHTETGCRAQTAAKETIFSTKQMPTIQPVFERSTSSNSFLNHATTCKITKPHVSLIMVTPVSEMLTRRPSCANTISEGVVPEFQDVEFPQQHAPGLDGAAIQHRQDREQRPSVELDGTRNESGEHARQGQERRQEDASGEGATADIRARCVGCSRGRQHQPHQPRESNRESIRRSSFVPTSQTR